MYCFNSSLSIKKSIACSACLKRKPSRQTKSAEITICIRVRLISHRSRQLYIEARWIKQRCLNLHESVSLGNSPVEILYLILNTHLSASTFAGMVQLYEFGNPPIPLPRWLSREYGATIQSGAGSLWAATCSHFPVMVYFLVYFLEYS